MAQLRRCALSNWCYRAPRSGFFVLNDDQSCLKNREEVIQLHFVNDCSFVSQD